MDNRNLGKKRRKVTVNLQLTVTAHLDSVLFTDNPLTVEPESELLDTTFAADLVAFQSKLPSALDADTKAGLVERWIQARQVQQEYKRKVSR